MPSIRPRISVSKFFALKYHAKQTSSDFNFKFCCFEIMPSKRLRISVLKIFALNSCRAYVFGFQFKILCFEIMPSIRLRISILSFVALKSCCARSCRYKYGLYLCLDGFNSLTVYGFFFLEKEKRPHLGLLVPLLVLILIDNSTVSPENHSRCPPRAARRSRRLPPAAAARRCRHPPHPSNVAWILSNVF